MVQQWTNLLYLHWSYDPSVVAPLLPPGVEIDEFEGRAWVGLIPFRMEGLGLPHLAPLPLVGSFPEVNVRTYVRCGDRRGVWFFSLDIDRYLPAVVARATYHLPYCTGDVTHRRDGDTLTTRVVRTWPKPVASGSITAIVGDPLDPDDDDPLDRFLTARWGLISSTRRGGLRYAPVSHSAWPLHRAWATQVDAGLVEAAGLPAPEGEPRALWSPGVDVRIGRPIRLRPAHR